MTDTFSGARILVVEDEALISILIEEALQGLGCDTVGPVPSIPEAMALAENEEIAAAVLDVNVGGEPVYPVASVLKRRGIPFVFVTGYQRDQLPTHHGDAPMLEKPFGDSMLAAAIRSLIHAEVG